MANISKAEAERRRKLNKAAVALGRKGGRSTSKRKQSASRENLRLAMEARGLTLPSQALTLDAKAELRQRQVNIVHDLLARMRVCRSDELPKLQTELDIANAILRVIDAGSDVAQTKDNV